MIYHYKYIKFLLSPLVKTKLDEDTIKKQINSILLLRY